MDEQTRKLYELKARVMQALGHPIRLAILDCLKDGELSAGEVAIRVNAERSNVSRHLSVMLQAGILESSKDGLHVLYRLKTQCVLGFMSCLTQVLREQAETSRALLKEL